MHLVDVGRELREEAKLAHVVARRVPCAFRVEARGKALLEALRVGANFVGDRPEPRCIERGCGMGYVVVGVLPGRFSRL